MEKAPKPCEWKRHLPTDRVIALPISSPPPGCPHPTSSPLLPLDQHVEQGFSAQNHRPTGLATLLEEPVLYVAGH